MKGKKGIEITTGTLIIIILAVIALIAIAAFFLGGFGKLADTIKSYFYGTTVGVTRESAVQFCEQYCDRAEALSSNQEAVRKSAYCTAMFDIDTNDDGRSDKKAYCNYKPTNFDDKNLEKLTEESLKVGCKVTCQ